MCLSNLTKLKNIYRNRKHLPLSNFWHLIKGYQSGNYSIDGGNGLIRTNPELTHILESAPEDKMYTYHWKVE